MPIRGVCPSCSAQAPLDAFVQEARYRQALAEALKMPSQLGEPVLAYMDLFRPASGRSIKADKLLRLITQLREQVESNRVERHGRAWVAPPAVWRQGIELVLERRDTLTLPLKGHGYLFEVVAGVASKQEGQAEAAREQHRQNPWSDDRTGGGLAPAGGTAAEVASGQAGRQTRGDPETARQYIAEATKQIGGKGGSNGA